MCRIRGQVLSSTTFFQDDNVQDDTVGLDNVQDDTVGLDNVQDDTVGLDNVQDDTVGLDNVQDDTVQYSTEKCSTYSAQQKHGGGEIWKWEK